MDTTALESAYRKLLDVARGGAFRPPADQGAWPAEYVLAHVVANDRLLAAATAEILAGERPSYDNRASAHDAYLADIGRAAGDLDGLVDMVRRCGLELVLLARRLDPDQAATPVQTRIRDGDEIRVDGPVPWSGVLNTHAEVHLPSHTGDLEALRQPAR